MAKKPPVSRRGLLGAGALAGISTLSGCTLLWELNQSRLEELKVSVYNQTNQPHSFRVRLFDKEDLKVFEGTFDPPPGESETQETEIQGGTEYQVLVTENGREVLNDIYHWGGCRTDEALIYLSSNEGNVTNANSCD